MLSGLAGRVMDTLRLRSVGQPLFWGTLSLLAGFTIIPSSFMFMLGVGLVTFGLVQGVRRFFRHGVRRAFSTRDNAINLLRHRARKTRDRRFRNHVGRLDAVLQRMNRLRKTDGDA